MNLKSRTKKITVYASVLALSLLPVSNIFAQSDDFGIWTSLEAKKKLTEKLEIGIEGELRTTDGVSEMDRRSLGVNMSYEFLKWLKADVGYVYIQSYNPTEKSVKDYVGDDIDGTPLYNYNIDHAYWEQRDRMYLQLTASWKVGRVKFSLRERLQYQYTHSELIYEDKYRYELDFNDPLAPPVASKEFPNGGSEIKDRKHDTVLRSRLMAKWDLKKCKFEPFASVELFSRTDRWKGHDKLRYRIGTEYKIDKDNDIQVYYQFQDNHSSDNPAGHAIGVGYSFEF